VFSTTLWGTSSSAGMSCQAGFAWVQPCDRAAPVDARLRRRRSESARGLTARCARRYATKLVRHS
jgi:hypothetical protein